MGPRFTEHAFQALHFHGKNTATHAVEAVIAAPRVIRGRTRRGFLDQTLKHQFFQVVVERAWAELVLPLRLTGNFLHDPVAMQVVASKSQQNVQGSGG